MTSVEQVLTRKIEKGRSPSIQYFFFDKDSIIASCRLGFSDIARQKRPDPTTTYNAFSVTKTFTALAVVQLAERGVIDLNKLVKDYLPDFSYGEGITAKHLLTHSAGIPNPFRSPGFIWTASTLHSIGQLSLSPFLIKTIR